MSEISPRRRRVDAVRRAEAVLAAATRVLGRTPDAGIERVAEAAGVSRQTVYAHYPSREALLAAVLDRITAEVLAELDRAEQVPGTAVDALLALLDASWRLLDRYPLLLHESATSADPADDHTRHEPIRVRLERLLRRGRETGEFAADLPPDWLVTAVMALGHAAGAEVGAGRMRSDEASTALRRSALRVLGAADQRAGPVGGGSGSAK